jgi:hypothetical protein
MTHRLPNETELDYRKRFTKDEALTKAFWHGVNWGVVGFAGGAGASYGLTQTKRFKPFMGTSAKLAIPLMAGFFMFGLKYEHAIYDAIRNPEKWNLTYQFKTEDVEQMLEGEVDTRKYKPLSQPKRVCNYMYDHPATMLGSMVAPLIGTVLYKNLHIPNLSLTQRLLNSRVMAQGGTISIIGVMIGFHSIMDRNGGKFRPEIDNE